MKKAIVIGSFGCGNKGDDAILDGFNTVIKGRVDLFPTSGKYGGLGEILDSNVKTLPLRLNEGFSLAVVISVFEFFCRYIATLLKVDMVIIGGGSLLHDLTPYNLPFYWCLQSFAQMFNKEVYYIGVGAGPINSLKSKKKIAYYLNSCNGVIVRDPIDCILLKQCGVENIILSADSAFAGDIVNVKVDELLRDNKLVEKEYIVVTACQWFKSDNFWNRDRISFDAEKEILIDSIVTMHETMNKKMVFLPTVMHDLTLGEEIESIINKDWFVCLSDKYSCKEMAAIIAKSYLVYGMRMHSLILAIRSSVPFLATVYDEKVRHLIERVGMEQCMLEFNELTTSKFLDIIKYVDNNYVAIAKKFQSTSQKFKNDVFHNIECLILK